MTISAESAARAEQVFAPIQEVIEHEFSQHANDCDMDYVDGVPDPDNCQRCALDHALKDSKAALAAYATSERSRVIRELAEKAEQAGHSADHQYVSLAAFASHTRREALGEAAEAVEHVIVETYSTAESVAAHKHLNQAAAAIRLLAEEKK